MLRVFEEELYAKIKSALMGSVFCWLSGCGSACPLRKTNSMGNVQDP